MKKCQLPGCGKTISKKARNQKYCSPEHMQQALAAKKTTASPLQSEKSGAGGELRFAKLKTATEVIAPDRWERPSDLPEELKMQIDFQAPGPEAYDADKLDQFRADEAGSYLEVPVQIGGIPYGISDEGIRQLNPITREDMDAFNQLREQQDREFREALGKEEMNQADAPPSPWQGDAPEGTLAFKLKYGVWYKKDLI